MRDEWEPGGYDPRRASPQQPLEPWPKPSGAQAGPSSARAASSSGAPRQPRPGGRLSAVRGRAGPVHGSPRTGLPWSDAARSIPVSKATTHTTILAHGGAEKERRPEERPSHQQVCVCSTGYRLAGVSLHESDDDQLPHSEPNRRSGVSPHSTPEPVPRRERQSGQSAAPHSRGGLADSRLP